MSSDEIRRKYIEFFKASPRNHKEIIPAPLILEGDPTTLFTSAGMQPLIPYLKGEPHPKGKRLVDSQPSLRLQDIEAVGDKSHTTFFEMLGNWSLGDYFKKEQLNWFFGFLYNEIKLDPTRLFVTIFKGDQYAPKDSESELIWREQFNQVQKEFVEIGINEVTVNEYPEKGISQNDRIFYYGAEKNWWSRSGTPEDMPSGEIGGPDSEVFYDFDPQNKQQMHESSKWANQPCHPNCECGRFMEIGNSVFIQYEKQPDGFFKELPQRNVDFGGGLERIAAAVNNNPDIFQIDIFRDLREGLLNNIKLKLTEAREQRTRIFLDHSRAAIFLIAEGLLPGKNTREYALRKLIRRADDQLTILNLEHEDYWKRAIGHFKDIYKNLYSTNWVLDDIFAVIINELRTYGTVFKNLEKEKQEFKELLKGNTPISTASQAAGPIVFRYQSTHGVPGTASEQIAQEVGLIPNIVMENYQRELEKHRELSRTASAGMFKGGLADTSERVVRLHTATHLIHAALRKVLGEGVSQKGSNITAERLRFDFSHPQKLMETEIKKVEKLVNEAVEKNLSVSFEEKSLDEALAEGALAFFGERYAGKVKVYTVGDFSKEVCGGPHVTRTSEVGRVRIVKQEKLGTGVVRIYATAG